MFEANSLSGSLVVILYQWVKDVISEIALCAGVLANKGGRTLRAAVVARQMNKVCIVGCRAITINIKERSCTIDKNVLAEGNYITLDGNTRAIYDGKVDVIVEKPIALLK